MAEEECNRRDVDTLVKEPHSEGMPEAVESDKLVDTCSLNELRDLVVQDGRGQGREDGSFLLDCPENCNCLLGISITLDHTIAFS